jgi:hypothetical protein
MLAITLSPDNDRLGRLVDLIGLFVTGAYLYTGIRFKTLLVSHPKRIEHILLAGAGYTAVVALLVLVLHAVRNVPITDDPQAAGSLGRSAFGLLITLYLLRNVQRLSSVAPKLDAGSGMA